MSDRELRFLDKFVLVMDRYYLDSIVQYMPSYLVQCKEDDKRGGYVETGHSTINHRDTKASSINKRIIDPDMIVFPNIKEQVCCNVKETIGAIELRQVDSIDRNNRNPNERQVHKII